FMPLRYPADDVQFLMAHFSSSFNPYESTLLQIKELSVKSQGLAMGIDHRCKGLAHPGVQQCFHGDLGAYSVDVPYGDSYNRLMFFNAHFFQLNFLKSGKEA